MPRSRSKRWYELAVKASDAAISLCEVQQEYQTWFDNLQPQDLESETAIKLKRVCEIDLEEAVALLWEARIIDPPLTLGEKKPIKEEGDEEEKKEGDQ